MDELAKINSINFQQAIGPSRRSEARSNGRIARFRERYSEVMFDFACHAAFPLTLTTDVTYLLRQKYFPELHWSAAADLLLSNLCDVAGHDLYFMDTAVRCALLDELIENFKRKRVDELAEWMANYISHRLAIETSNRSKVLGFPSEWMALACLKNDAEMTQQIKEHLKRILAKSVEPNEKFRLAALLEDYGDLLAQWGIEPIELRQLIDNFKNDRPLDDHQNHLNDLLATPEDVLKTYTIRSVLLDRQGRATRQPEVMVQGYVETLPQGLDLEMVAIRSGEFMMGSPELEPQRFDDEGPQHWVTVPPFFMGKYPVTQAQWRLVAGLPQVEMGLNPDPARFKGATYPVENVEWREVQEFCRRLSIASGRTEYRLPSEAEWEYACRAGTETPFYFGETITGNVANYDSSVVYGREPRVQWRQKTTEVGIFPPNAFGLYDMHGNVWEWCLDFWHHSYEGAPVDGSPWLNVNNSEEARRVLRGGSWVNNPRDCRSAYRYLNYWINGLVGFRVVCCAPRT